MTEVELTHLYTSPKANLKGESLTKFDGDCVGVVNGNNEGFLFVI